MHISINHKVKIPPPLFQLSTSHNYKDFFLFLSFRRTTGQAWKLLTRKWSYFGLEQSVALLCDFPFCVSSSTVYYIPPSLYRLSYPSLSLPLIISLPPSTVYHIPPSLYRLSYPPLSTVYHILPSLYRLLYPSLSLSSSFLNFKFKTNFWPNLLHCCISTGDAVYLRPPLSVLVYSRFIFYNRCRFFPGRVKQSGRFQGLGRFAHTAFATRPPGEK